MGINSFYSATAGVHQCRGRCLVHLYSETFTFIFSSALLATILATGCNNNNSPGQQTGSTDSLKEKSIAAYEAGEVLYKQYCAACHSMPQKIIDGPSLFDNLFERLPPPADEYFTSFVMNGKLLKDSGDAHYNQLQKTYRSIDIEHNYRTKISNTELRNIMLYIKAWNNSKRN